MEVLAAPFLFGGPVALWLGVRAARRHAEEKRRAAREAEAAEERRVRECGNVVLAFANHVGYLAREAVSRSVLADAIDSGISPGDLVDLIWERCHAVDGIFLGEHPIGSRTIPVKLPEKLRARHMYIVGKSGYGKTTLIRNLVLQDLYFGHGIGVIAPEQEMLTEEILPFIPEERWDDVIYVDPADIDRPVSFNPLHVDEGEDVDLKVDETFSILKRVFDDAGAGAAPRMEAILRQALYTLMQIPGTTLLDMGKLLDRQDPSFRKWAVDQVSDEEARAFWTSTYPSYPKDAHLALLNRLGRFLRPKVVRNVVCQPGASLDVRRAMDEGRILLFNLSDGILGEANAQLLGQLVVAKVQMAAMSRAASPKASRTPFYLYIDEFQSFCGVAATSYEKILSRARKYGLGLVLAHQQTGQIPEHLLKEILGNVSTMIAFCVGASDAKRIGREMVGEIDGVPVPLEPDELLSLRVGEAFCKIERTVFHLKGEPPPEGGSASARDEAVRRSREGWGVRSGREASASGREETEGPGERIEDIDPGQVF
ncbi:MAG: hypothetical protein ABIH26_12755 [Candidatus Eisenbacteria bacterium]